MLHQQIKVMIIVIGATCSLATYTSDDKKSETRLAASFQHAEFSPDGLTVMAYNSKGVSIYNPATRQKLYTITSPPLLDRPCTVYDPTQKQNLILQDPPIPTDIHASHYTDAHHIALVATAQKEYESKMYSRPRSHLSLWDITQNRPLKVSKPRWDNAHGDTPYDIEIRDFNSFTVAPKDQSYVIAEGANIPVLASRDHKGADLTIGYSGKTRALQCGLNGQVMAQVTGKHIMLYRQGLTPFYYTKNNQSYWEYHGLLEGTNAQYAHDDKRLKVITYDKEKVRIIDHPTLNKIQTLSYPSGKPIDGAIVSPTDSCIVTWSDKTAQRWEYLAKTRRYRLKKGAFSNSSPITTASINHDGTYAAFAHKDGSLGLWDLTTCEALCLPSKHKKAIKSISWSSNGDHIMTHKEDGTVKIWQAALLKQKLNEYSVV
jgi:WD40 repeat protein